MYCSMSKTTSNVDILDTYLEHLANNRFEKAAAQFTESCVYHHPPSFQDRTKVEGREELYTYFSETRGPKDIDHSIVKTVEDKNKVAIVGTLTGDDIGESYFVSYADIEDGKIAYYMAGMLG